MRKGPMQDRDDEGVADMRRAGAPAPPRDPEASSPRARVPDVVPAGWLDRLLVAVIDLPVLSGERPVVETLVDSVVDILQSYAVGVCLVADAGIGRHAQLVIKRLPEDAVERPAGIDPTRIFPGLAHEHVVAIPGGAMGSTMHIASDDHDLE